MITQEMPAVLDKRRSTDGDTREYLIEEEDGSQTWKSEDDILENYGTDMLKFSDSVKRSEVNAEAEIVDSVPGSSVAAVCFDSAQHLLQSISSDDEGSRSPSPVRRIPPSHSDVPSPKASGTSEAISNATPPRSLSPITMEDISNSPESEIASLICNLIVHDRRPFITHAIERFSYHMMLSLTRSDAFLSEIESWCRDAIDIKDVALVKDILLLVELLPISDFTCITSLFHFLSDSKTFAETDCSFLVRRILDKWAVQFPKHLDKSNGAKNGSFKGIAAPMESARASSTHAPSSSRVNRLPPNPRSVQSYRSRRNSSYPPPSNYGRKQSPSRLSPPQSRGRDVDSERPSPSLFPQSPPYRSPSSRDVALPKFFDQIVDERKSSNDVRSSREPHLRPSSTTSRHYDSKKSSYDGRSGSDYGASRSSLYQRDSQRGIPRSSTPPLRDDYNDRRVTESHRPGSLPDSRPRDVNKSSLNHSVSHQAYISREPAKLASKYESDPDKGYGSDSGYRKSYSRSDTSRINNSGSKRGQPGFDRPHEPTPVAYRSGIADSRSSKYSYDDNYPQSQRQSYLPPLDGRSVPSHEARSKSPLPYRNEMYMSNAPRRYDEPSSKRDAPKDYHHEVRDEKPYRRDDYYRDVRRDDEADSRYSVGKDYRREISDDSQQYEPRSFRRSDVAQDIRPSNMKRKPDFKWSHDGPNKSMRLSDEERRELVAKGACLYCRKPGHTISNCRTRPARS